MLCPMAPLKRSVFLSEANISDPTLPLEIHDTPRAYEISADLCGVPDEGAMVHISGRVLTITGDIPNTVSDDDEFAPSTLRQIVLLPPDVDVAHTSIHCSDGRVFLSIPRG